MKKFVSAVLVIVMLFAMSVCAFAETEEDFIATVSDLNRVSDCNSTTKYLGDFDNDGYNLAVFKKGSDFVIWTVEELGEEQEAELVAAIEASGAPGLKKLGKPVFASGFVTFKLINQDVTITEEGYIQFEKKPTWSWFYRGCYGCDPFNGELQ